VLFLNMLKLCIGLFFPTISLPHLSPPYFKQLQKFSLFYFIYVCKVHQPYSLSFIPSIHPPRSQCYPHPHMTCFTIVSIIFNYKVSVQRGFSIYLSCEYTTLWTVYPLYDSPFLFSPIPYYSTVFSTYHYAFYLHRCSVFRYYQLLFSFLFPSTSWIP
jgi:hypothetical protein